MSSECHLILNLLARFPIGVMGSVLAVYENCSDSRRSTLTQIRLQKSYALFRFWGGSHSLHRLLLLL